MADTATESLKWLAEKYLRAAREALVTDFQPLVLLSREDNAELRDLLRDAVLDIAWGVEPKLDWSQTVDKGDPYPEECAWDDHGDASCPSTAGGWWACSRPEGHSGRHVAGTYQYAPILGIWS